MFILFAYFHRGRALLDIVSMCISDYTACVFRPQQTKRSVREVIYDTLRYVVIPFLPQKPNITSAHKISCLLLVFQRRMAAGSVTKYIVHSSLSTAFQGLNISAYHIAIHNLTGIKSPCIVCFTSFAKHFHKNVQILSYTVYYIDDTLLQ